MAADLPVPKRIFAHGWWTKDGEKISKSLGNVIDPVELVDKVSLKQGQTRLMQVPNCDFAADSRMVVHSMGLIKLGSS